MISVKLKAPLQTRALSRSEAGPRGLHPDMHPGGSTQTTWEKHNLSSVFPASPKSASFTFSAFLPCHYPRPLLGKLSSLPKCRNHFSGVRVVQTPTGGIRSLRDYLVSEDFSALRTPNFLIPCFPITTLRGICILVLKTEVVCLVVQLRRRKLLPPAGPSVLPPCWLSWRHGAACAPGGSHVICASPQLAPHRIQFQESLRTGLLRVPALCCLLEGQVLQ